MRYVGLPFGVDNTQCMYGTVWLLGFMLGGVAWYAVAKPREFKSKVREILGR